MAHLRDHTQVLPPTMGTAGDVRERLTREARSCAALVTARTLPSCSTRLCMVVEYSLVRYTTRTEKGRQKRASQRPDTTGGDRRQFPLSQQWPCRGRTSPCRPLLTFASPCTLDLNFVSECKTPSLYCYCHLRLFAHPPHQSTSTGHSGRVGTNRSLATADWSVEDWMLSRAPAGAPPAGRGDDDDEASWQTVHPQCTTGPLQH